MEKLFVYKDGVSVEFSAEEYAQWEIDRANEQVFLAEYARNKRNLLLDECDWTQLADVPQATKDLWATYRQALRDVPQQAGFPTNVTWPQKP